MKKLVPLFLLFFLPLCFFGQDESNVDNLHRNSYWSNQEVLGEEVPSLFSSAPGGLTNYLSDLKFDHSSIIQFNQFGSFGLFDNGVNANVKTTSYRFLTAYSYRNNTGYRAHNNEFGTTIKGALQAITGLHSRFEVRAYYLSGIYKMPGSLLKSEFESTPFMADPRCVDRDERRQTTRGRVDLKYLTTFGRNQNNQLKLTAYGKVEGFVRTTKEYKIINRFGLGLAGEFQNTTSLWKRENVLKVSGEIITQPEKTEYYENFGGEQSDNLEAITNQNIRDLSFALHDSYEIIPARLKAGVKARYENNFYHIEEATLPSRKDQKTFAAFTPAAYLAYFLNDAITITGSYGRGFVCPTVKELESSDPAFLFNQELKAQTSGDFNLVIEGQWKYDTTNVLTSMNISITGFQRTFRNEIVPFEVFGEEYYRNAEKSDRWGIETKAGFTFLKDFALEANYQFTHAKYLASIVNSFEIENDSSENLIIITRDYSGKLQPGIPENAYSLSLSYGHSLWKRSNVFAKVSYVGMTGLWVDDANTDKTNSFSVLNVFAGFDWTLGHFDVLFSAGINNIFDKIYVGYVTANSANKRYYNPGMPRDYFCSVNFIYTF